jgi:hypothetical protein
MLVLSTQRALIGGAKHMADLSKAYDSEGTRRLVLAIVNQAIFDVLENNEAAKAAEQWLLSKDFDNCVELLNCVTCQHVARGNRKWKFGSKPIVRDKRPRSRFRRNMPDKMAVCFG